MTTKSGPNLISSHGSLLFRGNICPVVKGDSLYYCEGEVVSIITIILYTRLHRLCQPAADAALLAGEALRAGSLIDLSTSPLATLLPVRQPDGSHGGGRSECGRGQPRKFLIFAGIYNFATKLKSALTLAEYPNYGIFCVFMILFGQNNSKLWKIWKNKSGSG